MMRFGDFCRVHTAPARYLEDGLGVYVSAQDGSLHIGPAVAARAPAANLPLPDDRELAGMAHALRYGRSSPPQESRS